MPTRQFPNTDKGRIKVLNSAKAKCDSLPQEQWAISPETYAMIKEQLPLFETEVGQRGSSLAKQIKSSQKEDSTQKIAHFHISHFIQSFNFGIKRKVHKETDRAYYGLPVNKAKVPKLSAESDIQRWGQWLIDGETARTGAGGIPMNNPSISEVTAAYKNFVKEHNLQSGFKDMHGKERKDVKQMRPGIDRLVRDVYDEVEFTFRRNDAPSKRRKAREWGLVYIPLPGDKLKKNNIENQNPTRI